MTQLDEMHIYEEFNCWIGRIGSEFGRSMKDLVVMIHNHSHKCSQAIRINKGKLEEPFCFLS